MVGLTHRLGGNKMASATGTSSDVNSVFRNSLETPICLRKRSHICVLTGNLTRVYVTMYKVHMQADDSLTKGTHRDFI